MKHSKIFRIFLICLAVIAVERFCRHQTGGFRLSKALCKHPYPFSCVSGEVPDNLSQSFYYLGGGVQCYAFLGEDQETVLKLYKHHHMGLSTDLCKKILPLRFKTSLLARREKRMSHIFQSGQIAQDLLSEGTGTTFLHISKEPMGLGKTILYDKLGIAHEVDLDQTDFLIQKRADPAGTYLHALLKERRVDEAIAAMRDLCGLIKARSQKGIKNKDGNVIENCGFLAKQPIELDVGSFVYRQKSVHPDPHSKAAFRATLQLLGWVKKHYPEHLTRCAEELLHEQTP
jgi:hypothetical protein